MRLTLKRCTIRPWRIDDAGSLARHANNRNVWVALRDAFPHPYTIQDAHEFIRHAAGDQSAAVFCIEISGAAVGGIGIRLGQDVHRHNAELGYWLAEDFWGCGITTKPLERSLISASIIFHCGEFMPSHLPTIPPPHAYWKNPASVSKAVSKTMSSKMESFSIHCSTRKRSRLAQATAFSISLIINRRVPGQR